MITGNSAKEKQKSIFKKMWRFIKRNFDIVLLVAGAVWFVANIINPQWGNICDSWFRIGVGIVGIAYCLFYIFIWTFSRIRRDWLMIKGRFLLKVSCFVIFVPFVFAVSSWDNSSIKHEMLVNETVSPKDSVVLCIGDTCRDKKYVANYSQGCDSIIVIKENEDYEECNSQNPIWAIYYHFVDAGNQHMATADGGRPWAALISIIGILLLNGLLVSTIISWFDRRKERWQKGEIRYKRFAVFGKHYVIIGGCDVSKGVVKQIFAEYKDKWRLPYIVILTSSDVEKYRDELFANLSEREQKKVVIYKGDRTSKEDIYSLDLKKAKELYLLGEEPNEGDDKSYHDTLNMRCLDIIKDVYVAKPNKRLVCRVMFEYQTTFSVFQFSEISNEIKNKIDFKPFNYYEMWAQRVLVCDRLEKPGNEEGLLYEPLEGYGGIQEVSDKYVHMIIVGMSRMGVALGIETAHIAHYPNYKKQRTKITFIDADAKNEKDYFMGRFDDLFKLSHWRYGVVSKTGLSWKKHLPQNDMHLGGDFLDVEWEFINGSVEKPAIQDYIESVCSNPNAKVTIAMCLPEANRALASAIYLPRSIFKCDNLMQVLVYNRYGDSLMNAVFQDKDSNLNNLYNNKIKAFGMADSCYDKKLIERAEEIGARVGEKYDKICHEIDDTYGKDLDSGLKKSKVACWWSDFYNANMFWTKLRCIPMSEFVSKIDLVARVEHNRWNIEQLLMSFRPLTEDEQKDGLKRKNELKGNMAHLDICSNERLREIDPKSVAFDKGLSEILPEIYNELKNKENNHE